MGGKGGGVAMYQRKTRDTWELWIDYGQGWEHETTELSWREFKEQRKWPHGTSQVEPSSTSAIQTDQHITPCRLSNYPECITWRICGSPNQSKGTLCTVSLPMIPRSSGYARTQLQIVALGARTPGTKHFLTIGLSSSSHYLRRTGL